MEAKKKKKSSNGLVNTLIVLLLLVGLVLVFNEPVRNFFIGLNSGLYQIHNVSRTEIVKNQEKQGNFDFASVKAVSFNDVVNYQFGTPPLPVIGQIVMPDVGLSLPIFKGVDSDALMYGAGTMKANQVMGQGNYALASHNVTGYDSDLSLLFTPLEHAKTGMKIYTTDKENIYEYQVSSVTVVNPDAVSVIDDKPGKSEITLVTCADPEARQRIIVKGDFVGKGPYDGSQAQAETKKVFSEQHKELNLNAQPLKTIVELLNYANKYLPVYKM
ncbi:class A sortase [Lactococcus termiticola]|uniref:Sortase n=1 Tax=Lactococcus termiticola TaxID=2169526 RepID=A0A2R5HGL7_9LACT|nr:class A sortase [Lactococcus termiticola]GBG97189.1 sortase [Lactococcus termiticola]